MWTGGEFPGPSAAVAVVVIGNHGCSERIVPWNVWRFVRGTTSNVHVVEALVGGAVPGAFGFTCSDTVPRHVPVRKDAAGGGPFGERPQETLRMHARTN